MPQESSIISPGYEPIPGYVLRKKLGAGGYGEVWLADAPGGLQKALKIIFGAVEDARASRELKSLRRISQVYHPFLLSLERIEVVDNRVIIITELAEGSLFERFADLRREGASGIPRRELLEYLRDAADALDFLSNKHGLQHLDVKPDNLLLVGDRVKVADFGLIKDLQDSRQSLVGGMTPTYCPPEVFDGSPCFFSDQYSLAVVFMELLTGQLPFPGKTAGELARQHVGHAPNLEALPPADRPIVGRALSKNPRDRFANCKNFIEQLRNNKHAMTPSRKPAVDGDDGPHLTDPQLDRRTRSTTAQTPNSGVCFKALENADSVGSFVTLPNAFIALGGLGSAALCQLRHAVDTCGNHTAEEHAWLAIDTDRASLAQLTKAEHEGQLPWSSIVPIPVASPAEYRINDPATYSTISRRWLYNIPRSLQTEGVRPLATLALLHHFDTVLSSVSSTISDLNARQSQPFTAERPLNIYLLGSLHGATGSALLSEVGFIIQQVCCSLGIEHYTVQAYGTVATSLCAQGADLRAAVALTALSEIHHAMQPDNTIPPLSSSQQSHSIQRPFNWLTLVDGGVLNSKQDAAAATHALAEAVLADSHSPSSQFMREQRTADSFRDDGWLRSCRTETVHAHDLYSDAEIANPAMREAILGECSYLRNPAHQDQQLGSDQVQPDDSTAVAADTLGPTSQRLLAQFIPDTQESVDHEANVDVEQLWTQRMQLQDSDCQTPIDPDREFWQNLVVDTLREEQRNWQETKQSLLSAIEQLLNLVSESSPLAQLLAGRRSNRQLPAIETSIKEYLQLYAQWCLDQIQPCFAASSGIAEQLKQWYAETPQSVVPQSLRDVSQALSELIASANKAAHEPIRQWIHQSIDAARLTMASPPGSTEQPETPQLTLGQLRELVESTVARRRERIRPSCELTKQFQVDTCSLEDLDSFVPGIVYGVANGHQYLLVSKSMREVCCQWKAKQSGSAHLALLPGGATEVSYLVCEVSHFSLANMVNTLWRPSAKTLELAERLHTRVDIEWDPVAAVLEPQGIQDSTCSLEDRNRTPDPSAPNVVPVAVDEMPLDSGLVTE